MCLGFKQATAIKSAQPVTIMPHTLKNVMILFLLPSTEEASGTITLLKYSNICCALFGFFSTDCCAIFLYLILNFVQVKRILHQRANCHWPHAARHGSDVRSYCFDIEEI